MKSKEIDLDNIKKIELNILMDIDRVCRKYNISYTVFAGTMIGAVRHKGFIPWDDDIDIAMTRQNYNQFLKYYETEKKHNYTIVNNEKFQDFYCPFTKICDSNTTIHEKRQIKLDYMGVFVDIFPIDNISNRFMNLKLFLLKFLSKILFARGFNDEYYSTKSYFKRIIRKISFVNSIRNYILIIDKLSQIDNSNNTEKKGYLTGGTGLIDIWNSNIFNNYIDIEFEGRQVMILEQYDEMLKHKFGNYMEYPPIEERTAHHFIDAYYL